ncbi:MAG TPA: SusC/RagA family TonB-linked outer membrane protein [Gemmatimonadales bacterium]|nr:SusC/RagA family TonB-linked outer membrane protein [Gemmatimonadales bacterium]
MTSVLRRSLLPAALLLLPAAAAAQQPASITGQVTREDGEPLPGATVAIPSIGFGTTTRADGRYVLTVPGPRVQGQAVTLSVRAIGYKPETREIRLTEGEMAQNFSLVTNPLQLGELVVTGAGTSLEVEKLGSVRNNVDSTLIQRSNETNVVNALAAKAPNVEIVSTAGDPGANTAIRIRGANTLGSTGDPLFVVDGIPIDNSTVTTTTFDGTGFGNQQGTTSPNRASDLNPADIESVEILKGAAAGSIYGARAGQGVVLITTKRGRPGTTSYSLRSNLSINEVFRFPELQRRYGLGNGGVADPCVPSTDPALLDCEATSDSWGPELAPGTPTFDHAREVFKTGVTTDNTLTISGGTDRTLFYLSGGYAYQDGTIVGPRNNYERISVRLNGSHRVRDNLTVGGNVAYSNANGEFVQKGSNFSGILLGSWRSAPEFDNRDYLSEETGLHRSYRFPNPSASSISLSRGYDNPFFTANVPVSTVIADRIIGNVNLDWTPLGWLRFSYTLGVDYSGDDRLQGQPQTSSNIPNPLGQVIKLDIVNNQLDHNLTGTATYKLSPSLGGTITLGQNLNTRSQRILGGVGNSLLSAEPFTLTNTASQLPPVDQETKLRIEGYFGQATFDISDQLFLKAGVRYDGASTFSSDNQRAWYPSASAAWQFTKAANFGKVLSYGKLRAAYGEVGTQPQPYLTAFTFLSGGTYLDGWGTNLTATQGGFGGLYSDTTNAGNLRPERTKEFEAGFDVGLFNDVADLSFTWYRRTSSDVILTLPVAASTGFLNVASNAGEIRNSGTEWALNIRPITRKNFAWDLGFLLSTNRNRVVDLSGPDFVSYGGTGGFLLTVAQVGEPIGAFRDWDYVRCGRGLTILDAGSNPVAVDDICTPEQNSQEALFINDGSFANTGGDAGNGPGYPLLDPDSRIIGNPQPDWTGTFRTGVRLGKWSLSGLLDIRNGGLVYNGTRGALNSLGTSKESGDLRGSTVVFGQDFFPDTPVAGPGVGTPALLDESWFQNYYSTFTFLGQPFYESAGFVKLREISVGYSATGGFARRLGFSSIDFRLAGRNLAVWTDYTGVDPETSLGGAESGARGVDWFNNPQTRSWVFSVTLNR